MAAVTSAVIAGVGVAGSLVNANKQSKAAKGAANAQAQSAKDANQLQWQMFQQSRQDSEPFRQNALTAQQEYMALLGLAPQQSPQPTQGMSQQGAFTQGTFANNPFERPRAHKLAATDPLREMLPNAPTPLLSMTQSPQTTAQAPSLTPQQAQQSAFDRFRNTPGYQFGLQTGFDQVQASAAARGGLLSGATLKALQKFGNDYADQQGYTPYMNRLASLAGMGQTVNSQNAQLGMNYANQAGANLINAGNARASGIQNSANAWGNAAGQIAGIGGWLAGQSGSGMAPGAGTAMGNYNWASGSGFGNNWGNF